MTKCPSSGAELAAFHIAREKAEAGMTGAEKQKRAINAYWRGRKSTLTPEEKKERSRAYQRKRYHRLKAAGVTSGERSG